MRSRLIKRFEALVCTGSPGLYRVVTFFAVQHIYSLAELGHVASNLSIAQMAGFFTAIGWATLIMVRLPGALDRRTAVDTFYPLAGMALVTTLAVTSASIALALSGLIRFDAWGLIPLLLGWTAYQVARHYFVAQRRYRTAVAFDMALMASSGWLLWLCQRHGLSPSCALASAFGITAAGMLTTIGMPSRGASLKTFDVKGLQFGLTNFLSGGISLVFVPLATFMCGASFAGMLSLLASVTAVGMLLPRAISMAQLPELAKRRKAGRQLDDTLRDMRRSINWSNGVVLMVNVALVVGLTLWHVRGGNERAAVMAAGLLLAIQCAVGMMGIVGSSVMMAFEKGADTAKINVAATGAFALVCAPCVWYGGPVGFMLVLLAAIAVAGFRNWLVCAKAADVHRLYASPGAQAELADAHSATTTQRASQ
ncbi:hypothetical protein [Paraburkholderia sp. BCC1884]|uniref:hypothetical protein n=1 Tax=Paraburkholderia sp. BCC1884 TaxID=2562668 RepID=UPI00118330E9|nr:hypothetical protein [Paraburkholderia sp. BCC1884]